MHKYITRNRSLVIDRPVLADFEKSLISALIRSAKAGRFGASTADEIGDI